MFKIGRGVVKGVCQGTAYLTSGPAHSRDSAFGDPSVRTGNRVEASKHGSACPYDLDGAVALGKEKERIGGFEALEVPRFMSRLGEAPPRGHLGTCSGLDRTKGRPISEEERVSLSLPSA